jgi:apolipoprotein N-acyltransferase
MPFNSGKKNPSFALLSGLLLFASLYFDSLGFLALICLVPLIRLLKSDQNHLLAGLYCFFVGSIGVGTVFYGIGTTFKSVSLLVILTQSIWFFLSGLINSFFASRNTAFRTNFEVTFALSWVFIETVAGQAWLMGTWANGSIAIGYTQHSTWLLPLAAWFGVTGVSFAVVLINGQVAALFDRKMKLSATITRLAVIASVIGFANLSLSRGGNEKSGTPLQVTLVQTSPTAADDETANTDLVAFQALTNEYGNLSRKTTRVPDLIIWPESAVRAFLDDPVRRPILDQALTGKSNVLFGVFTGGSNGVFNSTALWDKKTKIATTVYDKRWLIGRFEDDLTSGSRSPLVKIHGITAGLGICWESTFSELSSAMVRDGAELLIYQSSTTFAGDSILSRLHLNVNVFRAVETGRFVVSSSKGGPSAIISPEGTLIEQSALGEKLVLEGQVQARTGLTPYVLLGNTVGNFAMVVVPCLLLYSLGTFRRKIFRTKSETPASQLTQ